MNQEEFLNRPSQRVSVKKMEKAVSSDYSTRVTTAPASKLPGDANSGYNGVDSKATTSYQPGGNQGTRMPFKSIRSFDDK